MLKKTTDQFIKDAIAVHGLTYQYDSTQYFGADQQVMIICRKHGPFSQQAQNHLAGSGCPKCTRGRSYKTTEHFIARARAVHGDKFDYGMVDYKGVKNKLVIICRKHGPFAQYPSNHLSGDGGCLCCSKQCPNGCKRCEKGKK